MRSQEQSSLGTVSLADCVQCMRMSSINVGLDYDNTVMLTCNYYLLTAAVYSVPDDKPSQELP